jgi:hypothetical protein
MGGSMVDRFAHDNRTRIFDTSVRRGVVAKSEACRRATKRINQFGINDQRVKIHFKRCQICAEQYYSKS